MRNTLGTDMVGGGAVGPIKNRAELGVRHDYQLRVELCAESREVMMQ